MNLSVSFQVVGFKLVWKLVNFKLGGVFKGIVYHSAC